MTSVDRFQSGKKKKRSLIEIPRHNPCRCKNTSFIQRMWTKDDPRTRLQSIVLAVLNRTQGKGIVTAEGSRIGNPMH